VEELNTCQSEINAMKIDYMLKLEEQQLRLTGQKQEEMEKRDYQIEQLYKQIADMEKTHTVDIQEVQDKLYGQSELSTKKETEESNELGELMSVLKATSQKQ
jgi:hypothetical protein